MHAHLTALRREGTIQTWYDREILPGGEIDTAIMQNLENSDIFLPIVSADFIASDYCYELEMQEAVERHQSGKMIIVPVIAEPCDWQSTCLKKFKGLPKDGKPISEWKNQNSAYLDIVMGIRSLVSKAKKEEQEEARRPLTGGAKKSRYKVKKDFNDMDIADFRDSAFNKIFQYFEESIVEINEIENVRARIQRIDPYSFTCSVLNMSLSRGAAHITVHAGTGRMMLSDIYYSFQENASKNTSNGGFNIHSDDYELFLTSYSFMNPANEEKFTPEQAAEILWNEFLEQAGISFAA